MNMNFEHKYSESVVSVTNRSSSRHVRTYLPIDLRKNELNIFSQEQRHIFIFL